MKRAATLIAVLIALLMLPSAFALVSVSHMGYHPSAFKSATVYTSESSGTYEILKGNTVVKSGPLVKATDASGNPVNCQGNLPCLIADFSDVQAAGTYTVRATAGGVTESSPSFTINSNIYRSNAAVFNGFFDALKQQGSSYHGNMNGFADPAFSAMADGSFINTAYQSGTTLVRLGSAYRRNPSLFDSSMVSTMKSYAAYLAALQDAKIMESPNGFRLGQTMKIDNAFVPGPTTMTSLDVYDTGGNMVQSVPVYSLCGNLTGAQATACLQQAEQVYKCQADEPCLEMSYNDRTGVRAVGDTDGLGVDNGWYYSWSCYFDVDIKNGNFNDRPNPCMIYDDTESYLNTAVALLAYTEAIPAIHAGDQAMAQSLFERAVATQAYIKANYALASNSDAAAFYGAASFLLYDMTGNVQYLQDAYSVRSSVNTHMISNRANGNEFYWQEYVRHKDALTQSGLAYALGGRDPATIFTAQMEQDYALAEKAISKNAERVYDEYRDSGFQNSRSQLAESIIASKALEVAPQPAYVRQVSDAQISWVTGNNAIDWNTAVGADDMRSTSFIFGIGTNPAQFHSRLLQDTGYSAATAGQVIGMHDTGFKFRDETGALVYLDGKTTILGNVFGGHGNEWRGEQQTQWLKPKSFNNGKSFINGWISGAFDIAEDHDGIYNYRDNHYTYEFTESENDMVATAIEAFAYADARYNNVQPVTMPQLSGSTPPVPPTPPNTNTTNTTNTTPSVPANATVNIASTPVGAEVVVGGVLKGMTPALGTYLSFEIPPGTYVLNITKSGYQPVAQSITLNASENRTMSFTLVATSTNTTNSTNSTPTQPASGAPSLLNKKVEGVTQQGEAYAMLETGTAVFTVQYNQSTKVDWYVNNVLMATATVADGRSSYNWSPTILYAGDLKVKDATIKAVGNGATNATFLVHVSDVVNPFWSGDFGTQDAQVHVFTQDNIGTYSSVSVELENGARRWNEQLTYEFSDENETEWKKALTAGTGNTYIRAILLEHETTGAVTRYAVTGTLAHYGGNPEGGRNGGGGGADLREPKLNEPPEMVYAVFSKDTAVIGDEITLTADVRDDKYVMSVDAIILHENGETETVPMVMTSGAVGYGTWSTIITGNEPGKYTLQAIEMTDDMGASARAPISDRAFYVLGDEVLASERLLLVYALLNASQIEPGERVGIKLDARDYLGVESVDVILKSKDRELPVKLARTSGSPTYGTWEGSVLLDDSDSTYSLVMARMSNGNETKETRIYGQKVYVKYVKPAALIEQENAPEPSRTELRQIIRNPVTPLLIGLIGMGLAMLIVSSMAFMKSEK